MSNAAINTTCLTALLATAWAAPAANAQQVTGTVSPTNQSLTDVALVYNYNVNPSGFRTQVTFLPDIPAGTTQPFTVAVNDPDFASFGRYVVLGVYDGTEAATVTVAISPANAAAVAGKTYEEYFNLSTFNLSEIDLQTALQNDDAGTLASFLIFNGNATNLSLSGGTPAVGNLYNFSEATLNGSVSALGFVPEPTTAFALAAGGGLVARRRRRVE